MAGFKFEDSFFAWLSARVTPAQLSALYSAFTEINNYCLNKGLLAKPLFETDDLTVLLKIQTIIERNRIFAFTHRKQKNVMLAAIRHYCRFIEEGKKKKDTEASKTYSKSQSEQLTLQLDDKPVPNKPKEVKISSEPTSKTEAVPKTEIVFEPEAKVSEIDELLKDEIFLPLRAALAKENIRKTDELKDIKLWAFMNKNNLYTISERQNVLTKVKLLLEPPKEENPELLYRLRCGSEVYTGETPSKAFLHFCEEIAGKYPLFFRSVLGWNIGTSFQIKILRSPERGEYLKMENPTCYISAELKKDEVVSAADWLYQKCFKKKETISMDEPKSAEVPAEAAANTEESKAVEGHSSVSEKENKANDLEFIDKVEKFALKADMKGVSCEDIRDFSKTTLAISKAAALKCSRLVEIKGRFYHEEAFVDWDEGAEQLCDITEKLMQRNSGYISAAQLYEFARSEMNMFLNDNDLNDERSVFEMAQHLFQKNSYKGFRYIFSGKNHISKADAEIGSNFDIICKYAEDQGGLFSEEDLTEYLNSVGIKTGSVRSQMKINTKPIFFFYDKGMIISAKSMNIDDLRKEGIKKALDKLFDDIGDHIIIRDIQPVWYEQLPALPGGIGWTPLLLQGVLRFFGEELGAKTIGAMDNQKAETLHTMLVKYDSQIQNFGDAVVSYIVENEIEKRSFEAEELRQLLVESKMIQGSELVNNMPKALAKDERFAWDAKGRNVTIRV